MPDSSALKQRLSSGDPSFRRRAAETLAEIEAHHPIDEFRYKGLNVWPVIRAHIGRSIQEPHLSIGRFLSKLSPETNFLKNHMRQHYSDVPDTDKLNMHYSLSFDPVDLTKLNWPHSETGVGNTDFLFFARRQRHIHKTASKYYSFPDLLISELRKFGTVEKIEEYDSGVPLTSPRLEPSQYFVTRWAGDKDFLMRRCAPKLTPWPERKTVASLLDRICQQHGLVGIRIYDIELILQMIEAYLPIFDTVLATKNPKAVFFELFAEPATMALCMAAQKQRVKSVEIQHGLIGAYQWEYTHWSNFPEAGFSQLPDAIWVWDTETKEDVERHLPMGSVPYRAVVGGNPTFFKSNSRPGDLAFRDNVFLNLVEQHDGPIVLATLQYDETFPQLMLDSMAQAPANWLWLIRLHPQSMPAIDTIESSIRSKGLLNFDIRHASSVDLFELMMRADHLVTGYSTTSIEAQSYGLDVSLYHTQATELLQTYIEDGRMQFCPNSEDLISNISNGLRKKDSRRLRNRYVDQEIDVGGVLDDIFAIHQPAAKYLGEFDQAYSELLRKSRKKHLSFPIRPNEEASAPITEKLAAVAKSQFPESSYSRLMSIGNRIHAIELYFGSIKSKLGNRKVR